MTRVEELEGQIKALSSNELQELRAWLAEYDAEVWDRQFHADAISGRLDAIADQAIRDLSKGRPARVGLRHRSLAVEIPGGLLWFWFGDHDQSLADNAFASMIRA